jgi:UDP-2,3-diacylglucosamine pyrophosphatase LpxH
VFRLEDLLTMTSTPPEASNYLLFSDVHLGADLVQHTRPWTASRLLAAHRIDQTLGSMLDHYRENREDGRMWRVVIAGDFIDLVGMSISAVPGVTWRTPLSEDDQTHGLGSAEDHAAFKMHAVADRHDLLFRKLAKFVEAGHSLVLIRGNHDVEMYWDAAQRAFLDALLSRASFSIEDQAARDQFESRVEFQHWFFYVRGFLYVEHGHQYDATCAYHNQLAPRSPRDPRRISYSFSDILLRYVVRPTRELSAEGHDNTSMFDFIRLAFSLGLSGCAKLGYRFFSAVGRMVGSWRDHLSVHAQQIKAEHERHMQQISKVFRLSGDNLKAMTKLWATPVTTHFFSIFRNVFLDGLAAGLTACGLFALLAVLHVLPWMWLPPTLVALVVSIVVYMKLSRVLEPHAALRLGASRLAELVSARYVVMGHTHKPMMEALTPATTYVNLGNWTNDTVDDQVSGAPCTHLVIRHGDGGQPEARLCGWDGLTGPHVLSRDARVSAVVEGSEAAAMRGIAASQEPSAQPRSA